MTQPVGASLCPVEDPRAELDEVAAQVATGQPGSARPDRWLLAQADGGVTWGYRSDGRWYLHSLTGAGVRPGTLQELRLFDAGAETLIWRAGGELRGRVLRDAQPPAETVAAPPLEERQLLLGTSADDVTTKAGGRFTVSRASGGATHAVPFVLFGGDPDARARIVVRHYFAVEKFGVARVCASRLCGVERLC